MITISTEMGIAVIVALTGCITFLFRALMVAKNDELKSMTAAKDETIREKDDMIKWLREEVHHSLRTLDRATAVAETATTVARKVTDG